MTDLHVTPGETLTAERWNALVDLASGKRRPLEARFTVPTRVRPGSAIAAAIITGTKWERYHVDYWKTTGLLEGVEIEVVAAPPTGTGYTNTAPKIKPGSRVRVWKNGTIWELLDDPRGYSLYADARIVDGELLFDLIAV